MTMPEDKHRGSNLIIGTIWIDVSISEQHSLSADVTEHPVEAGTNIVDNIRPKPRTIRIEGLVTNHPVSTPLSHAGDVVAGTNAGHIAVTTVPGRRMVPMSVEIEGEPSDFGLGFVPGFGQAEALAGTITGVLGLDVNRPKRRFAAERNYEDRTGRTEHAVSALTFDHEFNRVLAVYAALVEVLTNARPVSLITGLDIYKQVALSDLSFDRSSDVGPSALKFTATCTVLRIVNAQTAEVPPAPVEERGKPGQSRGKQQTTMTVDEALPPAGKEQRRAVLKQSLKAVGSLIGDIF
jgi:hypothetical protein